MKYLISYKDNRAPEVIEADDVETTVMGDTFLVELKKESEDNRHYRNYVTTHVLTGVGDIRPAGE